MEQRRGLVAGAIAYGIWGVFPFYFHALAPAPAVEVLAHRILWALLVCLVLLTALRRWGAVAAVLRSPRQRGLLAVAAVVIAVNWGVYVHGVASGHVLEASLGYFVNPLVTVLLGVVVLRERLRRLQWVAVAVGTVAVTVITVDLGRPPWIALLLAASFATYGLMKNRLGQVAGADGKGVDAITSLSVETLLLGVPAAAAVAVLTATGGSTFTTEGPGHTLLLALTGVTTVVPLVLFAVAASRVPLSTIGLLQYLTPVLQFGCALVLGERMAASQWAGFALVWVALLLLSTDALRGRRRPVPVPA
ncbi:EamA family transporter RarD [Kineococcus siccus]|uniref:EamA family transporter RarD n=1 Tax=Kineococcus siccus TaxID=2696567 RepID=UPI0030B845FD